VDLFVIFFSLSAEIPPTGNRTNITEMREDQKNGPQEKSPWPVQWTLLEANTLRKTGENALSADRVANALQDLAEFRDIALLVESWSMIASSDREALLQLLPLTQLQPCK